ncbi:hypothetical protein JY97_10435 [Alkalispirochaeta odontotermitis]|nr:hypothetical protein JY97_10435 [Alkalispirochaeta odontotermitis]CAB1079008.1 hypothetical protein D1AOALGA4SA_6726 [Olavius algarvensis Delta 1 endosymbiont]
MKREELVSKLGRLGYTLLRPVSSLIEESEVLDLLDELAGSEDSRLVEGFPVVLANCAQRNLALDFKSLLSRNKSDSRKKRSLEKLLLLSSVLLAQQNLGIPKTLASLSKSLKTKHGDLLSEDFVDLGNQVSLSTERLRNTLGRYAADLSNTKLTRQRARNRQRRSFQLNYYLSALFAPKQKELVLKKFNGEPLNKTEQEYFSRKVKKKLEAMTNKDVMKVAATVLTRK